MPNEEAAQLNLFLILEIKRYRLLAGKDVDELTFVGGLPHSIHSMTYMGHGLC